MKNEVGNIAMWCMKWTVPIEALKEGGLSGLSPLRFGSNECGLSPMNNEGRVRGLLLISISINQQNINR